MIPADPDRPDDAALVAWIDDELDDAAAAAVAAAVRRDPQLASRARLLRAVRAEFTAALLPEGAAPRAGRRRAPAALLLAAAALVVVVLARTGNPARDAAAANDWLQLRMLPGAAAWDLFAAIRFELEGVARTATPVRIVARKSADETDAQLTARVGDELAGQRVVPVVLEAALTGPDGAVRSGPVLRVHGEFGSEPGRLAVELVDAALPHPGVAPFVAAALRPEGPTEDFLWSHTRVGHPAAGGRRGCVPEDVGDHRLEFTLRSFTPAEDARWPRFGAPLVVSTGFAVRGVVGAYSEPVDGLRARLVAPASPPAPGAPLPFALQLRNDGDRPRVYNVAGATMAPVPQPFHFELRIGDRPCRQRDDLAVIFSGGTSFLPHPPHTLRSVVVLADYWRLDDSPPSVLHGRHRLSARFHFVPTLWTGDPDALWRGEVTTPPVEIDFGPPR